MIASLPYSFLEHQTEKAVLLKMENFYFWYAKRFVTLPSKNAIDDPEMNPKIQMWFGDKFNITIFKQDVGGKRKDERSVPMKDLLENYLTKERQPSTFSRRPV